MNVTDILLAHGFVPAVPTCAQTVGTLEPLQDLASPLSLPSPTEDVRGECSMRTVTHVRANLMALAGADGLSADLVHGLVDADILTCIGETDVTLTAYLRALAASRAMDVGQVPPGWGGAEAAICDGCGPVLLWPGSSSTVKACPWCFKRKAGKVIPRPSQEFLRFA